MGSADPATPKHGPPPLWLWGPRLIAAGVMAFVAYLKLTDNPADIAIFTQLGMEPHGRYLVGAIEGFCALVLLSPYAPVGAVMTSGVMLGAIIAHATKLGLIVNGDGGKHVGLLALVFLSSLLLAFFRRRELPLIGETL